MPPFPGEERLVTLFTDCHYYFAQPTTRPVLHRFDKASYFYIYYNSTRQTSRIEVANNPGSPEQDAFSGQLDTCRIINSYKFPTLVTLVVDAISHAPTPVATKAAKDLEGWQLPSADPRDMNRTTYRLHTVDFYFWTQEDARLVIDFFKKLLNPAQLDLAEPAQLQQQTSRDSGDTGVSSVVQNLENVAITDPAYSNGQTRNSRNEPQQQNLTIPPPPPPPSQPPTNVRSATSPPVDSPSPASQVSNIGSRKSPQPEKPALDYTPIAYNPAAPPAPEKIAHREPTPPPEDGHQGTGLSAAAMHEQVPVTGYNSAQPWGAPLAAKVSQSNHWGSPPPGSQTSQSSTWGAPPSTTQATPSNSWGSPPPASQATQSKSWGSPPPTSQATTQSNSWGSPPPASQTTQPSTWGSPPPGHGVPSFNSPPGSAMGYASAPQGTSQHQRSPVSPVSGSGIPSFAPPPANPPPPQDSHRHSIAAEMYTPDPHQSGQQPVETPGTQFYNTVQQPNKPLAHIQPQYADYLAAGSKPGHQPPSGGYAEYSYNQGAQPGQSHNDYDVHSQVYRPTEAEANSHSHSHSSHKRPSKSSRSDASTSSSAIAKAGKLFSWGEKRANKLIDKAEAKIG